MNIISHMSEEPDELHKNEQFWLLLWARNKPVKFETGWEKTGVGLEFLFIAGGVRFI